ncbi:NHLP leader peptide family RiPP precursor [Lacihabitans lacunae]|jgi:ABC-type bacteriocin/lantibiotic exporter with double-glycine peptidase domain|uniref:NHLP leader peptide family RiPP n=1 Tax=Lacihabitans lacunae TaxID=1028214 RepID=A0ABV7YWU0_9BACT
MEHKKQQVLQAIISKAWEDTNFRKALISNPIEEIEKLTGVKVELPEGRELVIIDQTDKSKVYVNIPAEPEMENMELSEEQLENIAGGGQMMWNKLVQDLFPTLEKFIKI